MSPVSDAAFADRLVATRRDFHRYPELSWQERRTSQQIHQALERLGIRTRRSVAGTGIIADIPGVSDGLGVALRADIDALPITEETGLPFTSAHEGVMHACGHDAHTSMLLGAAELLLAGPPLPAPVRLIFQPAEEVASGAIAMIEDGALDGMAMIFGGHVDRHFPTGTIVVTDGVVNASTDAFRIEITGRGGHAARPHEGVDAVVVGSLLVMSLQTIVSREVNPAHPSVVTIGRFDAGTASNVIASHAVLEGTIRAQEEAVRTHLIDALQRIAAAVGQLHGAAIRVTVAGSTPCLVNTPPMTALARDAAQAVVGPDQVATLQVANMGGEDFAYYLRRLPGCYVRFGAQALGREAFPAHSSKFDIDEGVLPLGARFFSELARLAGARVSESSR
ncbi:MAG TPA: M20 family metallopeptidase [Gemmatimonadales bacterium]|nr:M20 family metallopeptidase [Gemmatimonadales bacterium]